MRKRLGVRCVVVEEKNQSRPRFDETENTREKIGVLITNSVCSRSRIQGLKGITFLLLFVGDATDLFCPIAQLGVCLGFGWDFGRFLQLCAV